MALTDMNTPFRLDDHRRRPQPPLAAPPERYFEQLPMRVMQRVQPDASPRETTWSWLAALSAPMRTALASVVVMAGFAASFLLSPTATTPVRSTNASTALAQVPQEEMVQYLLAAEQRVTLTDLAELPTTVQDMTADSYLHASPDEVQDALDAQPTEETYL